MLRKGRCSNLPENCNFAKEGTLLPFAGVGSICPECSAPLALVAIDSQVPSEPASAATFQNNVTAQPANYDISTQYDEKPSNSALTWTINIALVALIAAGVFFGLKHFNNKDDSSSSISNSTVSEGAVSPYSPPKIGRAIHDIQGKTSPDEASTSLGLIAEGTAIDITGEVTINNVPWLRITMPNQATQIGYVKKSDIENLGEGIEIIEGGIGNEILSTPPTTPIASEITPMSDQLYYVTSTRANIRQEAGATAPKIGEMLRGDTLIADASRIIDGKTWFRVKMPNGNVGWISSSLLSLNEPQAAPEPPEPDTKSNSSGTPVTEGDNVVISSAQANVMSKPVVDDSTIVSRADKGMVLQVQEVLSTNGQTWYRVRSNRFGIDGWISASTARNVN